MAHQNIAQKSPPFCSSFVLKTQICMQYPRCILSHFIKKNTIFICTDNLPPMYVKHIQIYSSVFVSQFS